MNHWKSIFLVCTLLYGSSIAAQKHQLTRLWETDSTFKVPESVLYSREQNILYVSNIDGKPDEKDLNGSISKLSLDGKTVQHNWAINLSAPKGMGIYQNKLYVADIDEVVVIDLKTAKTIERIAIPGSVFLNDITISTAGIVYVSDSQTGKIHQIKSGSVTTYLENKPDINGLLADADNVYLVVKDTLFISDKNKALQAIATGMDESTDGIVKLSGKDFIISCWNGIIYYVKQDGTKEELVDTREQKSNTADIGFNPQQNVVYVPTFFKNKVVAYQLK